VQRYTKAADQVRLARAAMAELRKDNVVALSVAPKAPALSIAHLSVCFGERNILQDINLDVRQAEFVCIIGPSGSGKTTLLRILAGLVRPTEGGALFEGIEIAKPSRERAIIFQDYWA